FQDALASWRTRRGEKTVALDLGIIDVEGFLAENKAILDRQVVTGLELPANILNRGHGVPSLLQRPLFRYMH
ncbi:hypothetical protein BU23DRAFT_458361, partial [Bimuria novae-zelandiae CBS 107.79]